MEKVLYLLSLAVIVGGVQRAAFKLPSSWIRSWTPPPRNFEIHRFLPPASVSRFPVVFPTVIRAHTSPLLQGPQTDHTGQHLFPQNIHFQDQPDASASEGLMVSPEGASSKRVFSSAPQQLISPTLHLFSPVIMQQRSQDEEGGYHFSYSGGPTSRTETRDHEGVVRGAYSYIDPNGEHQEYQYIADKGGYRVTKVDGGSSGTRASSIGMGSSIVVPAGAIQQGGTVPSLRIMQIPEVIIARKAKALDVEPDN